MAKPDTCWSQLCPSIAFHVAHWQAPGGGGGREAIAQCKCWWNAIPTMAVLPAAMCSHPVRVLCLLFKNKMNNNCLKRISNMPQVKQQILPGLKTRRCQHLDPKGFSACNNETFCRYGWAEELLPHVQGPNSYKKHRSPSSWHLQPGMNKLFENITFELLLCFQRSGTFLRRIA